MKKAKFVFIIIMLFLLTGSTVLAMSSTAYNLPWQSLSAGGEDRESANYALRDTIGQSSAVGVSESTNYRLATGYWYGASELSLEPPAVITGNATNITASSATLHGSLDDLCDYSSANVSFEWGTTSSNLTHETAPEAMTSTGNFSATIIGLLPGTNYYFKAKATSDNSTAYGDELSFTTLAIPTEVWVDDGWDGSTHGELVDVHVFGVDAFANIQDGIVAVSSPGIVHVASGTYYENITLKDGVEVLGAGADVTTIDGGGSGSVVTADNVGSATKLDGFTITNGGGSPAFGIGISSNSTLTISNNIITNNSGGTLGFGINIDHSSPVISNNIITSNSGGTSGYGIGVGSSSATISNNIITNNGGGGYGFGITVAGSSATISNNIIANNSGDENGFGIQVSDSSANISNNIITNNGGGNLGFGIHVSNSSAAITNNTVANNSDRGISCFLSSTTIFNCIIWGNGDDLCDCSANYSDIEDMDAGTGNIHDDPMFVSGGDYHLLSASPCIDAGDNTSVPSWLTTDFEGDPRIVDGDGDSIAVVDMGADEAILVLTGDANGDSDVNVLDMTKVARIILLLDEETPGADANQDGVVNVLDMTKIARIILGLD